MKILLLKYIQDEMRHISGSFDLALFYLKHYGSEYADIDVLYNRYLEKEEFISEFRKKIKQKRYDYIGIVSVNLGTLPDWSLWIRDLVNEASCPILMGGPLPSSIPDFAIEKMGAKYVFIGDGEWSFRDFCSGKKINEIPSIYYKGRKECKLNPVKNLDELPMYEIPDSLNDQDLYIHYSTSRGCSYNCFFCYSKSMWGNLRRMSPKKVIDDILNLKKQSTRIKSIYFPDDTFTFDKIWIKDFCDMYIDEKIDIPFKIMTRIDCVDDEILKMLLEAGCISIAFGINGGSDRILKLGNRKHHINIININIDIISNYEIDELQFQFIIGFPDETEEEVIECINLAKEIKNKIKKTSKTIVIFGLLSPYPGSPYHLKFHPDYFNNFDISKSFKDQVPNLSKIKNEKILYYLELGNSIDKMEDFYNIK
ncbi:MAG: B12-binding domain-containing radical SAM protein [bacterium]